MRKGLVVPYADSRDFAGLAALAEEHGWDGIFTWEALFGVDAWVSLAAAALETERIRLGTLLTPAARFKPWDLASRVGTVDRISNGRVTLSVGLGAVHAHWLAFEPDEGRKTRAEKLDECLAIDTGAEVDVACRPRAAERRWEAGTVARNRPPVRQAPGLLQQTADLDC